MNSSSWKSDPAWKEAKKKERKKQTPPTAPSFLPCEKGRVCACVLNFLVFLFSSSFLSLWMWILPLLSSSLCKGSRILLFNIQIPHLRKQSLCFSFSCSLFFFPPPCVIHSWRERRTRLIATNYKLSLYLPMCTCICTTTYATLRYDIAISSVAFRPWGAHYMPPSSLIFSFFHLFSSFSLLSSLFLSVGSVCM